MKKIFAVGILLIGSWIWSSCETSKEAMSGNMMFANFEKNIQLLKSDNERQKAVTEFIEKVMLTGYPIFENDTTVVLLHQSNQDSAYILGDMGYWVDYLPMHKFSGTNLFYFRGNYERDARLEYWIAPSKAGFGIVDSLNPNKVLNGFGPMSELVMPGYTYHEVFRDYRTGKKGDLSRVRSVKIQAGVLPYEHQLHVYLPPGYAESADSYPAIYFQDGLDYIEFAQVPDVLDQLIHSGKIPPLIAVFVEPPNRFKPDMPNRMTEYGLNEDYVRFFTDDLVPFIDKSFRTKQDASQRLVIGDSFGGLISAYIPFCRPDVFGLGYSQSGYVSFQQDRLIKTFGQEEKKPIRLFVDIGTYELAVGGAFLPSTEINFLKANQRFRQILDQKGYDVVYQEYHEGHTWGNWRRHLIDALQHFFGK